MLTPVVVRVARLEDMAAIRDIYNHYVLTSTCTYQLEPDSVEERLRWFQDRSPAHPVTVAERDGEVVGWAALSPWKPRAGYSHTVEGSVYVREGQHRQGIGRALLLDLIERARSLGHHVLVGGASADQEGSIALQEAVGFQRVAHFRETGYKFGRWLDVIYLQLVLS